MKPLLWRRLWFLKKIGTELPYDSATPFLDMHMKEEKAESQTVVCTPMFTATLFTIVPRRK